MISVSGEPERRRRPRAVISSGSNLKEMRRRPKVDIPPDLGPDRHGALRSVKASDVVIESVEWLWERYLPRGKLVDLSGDPGLGKSTMALDLAARLTVGVAMPGSAGACAPGAVIVVAGEDGLADTVVPRLRAAGADRDLVHHITEAQDRSGTPRPFTIPNDIDDLRGMVEELDARMVVIDPLSAHLSGRLNDFKDHDVRQALHPLARLAEATGATVLMVRHLNKRSAGSALYRPGGSIGITGAIRVGLMVGRDPEDPTKLVMAQYKCNVGRPAPSQLCRIVHDESTGVGRVMWLGTTALTADDFLANGPRTGGALILAKEVLTDALACGAIPASEIEGLIEAEGISKATYRRAKKELGIRSRQRVGATGAKGSPGWEVYLPNGQDESGGHAQDEHLIPSPSEWAVEVPDHVVDELADAVEDTAADEARTEDRAV